MKPRLYTIGYAPHTIESFVVALGMFGITSVLDVRSSPYSSYQPDFNKEGFGSYLRKVGVEYVFLGDYVGARFSDASVYRKGAVAFELAAQLPVFKRGLNLIEGILSKAVPVLMCAEKDPISCHRTILVSRHLKKSADVVHILADGSLEAHAETEKRLVEKFKLNQGVLPGLGRFIGNPLEEAYRRQGEKIAYREKEATVEADVKKSRTGLDERQYV